MKSHKSAQDIYKTEKYYFCELLFPEECFHRNHTKSAYVRFEFEKLLVKPLLNLLAY